MAGLPTCLPLAARRCLLDGAAVALARCLRRLERALPRRGMHAVDVQCDARVDGRRVLALLDRLAEDLLGEHAQRLGFEPARGRKFARHAVRTREKAYARPERGAAECCRTGRSSTFA